MGLVFLVMGFVIFITQGFFIGRMIKALGEETLIKYGLLLSAIGYVLTVYSWNLITLIIFVNIATIGNAFCRPCLASIISKRTEYEEGVTMGTMQSMDSLGRILGPIFGGFVFSIHYFLPYVSGGGFNLLFLLIFMFI
jgi:MFS family permease